MQVTILMPGRCWEQGSSFIVGTLKPLLCPPLALTVRLLVGPGARLAVPPALYAGILQGMQRLLHAYCDGMSTSGWGMGGLYPGPGLSLSVGYREFPGGRAGAG